MSTVDMSTSMNRLLYPTKFMIFGKISGNTVLGVTFGNLDKENMNTTKLSIWANLHNIVFISCQLQGQ